jgi:hypothetical protein
MTTMRGATSLRAALAFALALAVSGCFNAFNVLDSDFKPRGRSIAVLAGVPEEANVAVAALVADELRKQSRYQVVPHAQVAKTIKPYPQAIKGPYRSAYFAIDVDWGLTDRQKLTALQHALGVDYLYVIWAPTAVSYGGSGANLQLVGQLFEFPGAKEVGHGAFQLFVQKDSDHLKQGAEKVARQVAEETGMLKR